MTKPKTMVSTTQAAKVLGVSAETVRTWTRSGRLRHVVLPSGRFRYDRDDLESILTPVEPTERSA